MVGASWNEGKHTYICLTQYQVHKQENAMWCIACFSQRIDIHNLRESLLYTHKKPTVES